MSFASFDGHQCNENDMTSSSVDAKVARCRCSYTIASALLAAMNLGPRVGHDELSTSTTSPHAGYRRSRLRTVQTLTPCAGAAAL